jgi:hypothetical protein
MVPRYEPVIIGKTVSVLEKFGVAEEWIPAFAGMTKGIR